MAARTPLRRGFTLIEIMIVVVVLAILVSVALPAYTSQLRKSRRADAKQAMVELAQRLERFYTERSTYAGAALGAGGIFGSTSAGGYYSLEISSQTATAFTIKATPIGAQAGDACGSYGYDQAGNRSVSGGSLGANVCW